ncbi:hypothetical protein [Streptomyces sp. NPDC019937]|uniref:hypothetical protein n=1 Tax=Streptomyces sp. NPDC019937 TaxID=3154787 RepID=UPI0033FA4288
MAEMTIHIQGEGGQVIAMDLPLPDHIADRLTKGQLRRVNADGSPYLGGPSPSAPADETGGGSALTNGVPPRPAAGARKADWVGWAVAVHGLDPEVAEGMTKGDLQDLPDQPAPDGESTGRDSDLTAGRSPRPDEDAPKADWIAYIVSTGQLSAEDAANYTREDLIDMAK